MCVGEEKKSDAGSRAAGSRCWKKTQRGRGRLSSSAAALIRSLEWEKNHFPACSWFLWGKNLGQENIWRVPNNDSSLVSFIRSRQKSWNIWSHKIKTIIITLFFFFFFHFTEKLMLNIVTVTETETEISVPHIRKLYVLKETYNAVLKVSISFS